MLCIYLSACLSVCLSVCLCVRACESMTKRFLIASHHHHRRQSTDHGLHWAQVAAGSEFIPLGPPGAFDSHTTYIIFHYLFIYCFIVVAFLCIIYLSMIL
jgi:hypothetical protein